MKSLIVASLLLVSDAIVEETSLMQGLVARRGQISPGETSRQDATTKLMETATNMMKSGATPDVVEFIEVTINKVNQEVLGQIVLEHHEDQNLLNQYLTALTTSVAEMEGCKAEVEQKQSERESASEDHKQCRSEESLACARSRKCESELEVLWSHVKIREGEMRRIHWAIHSEWCVGPDDPHPNLADPFHWDESMYWEGEETSDSVRGGSVDDLERRPEDAYPAVDLSDDVIEFRRFSVDRFGAYIAQKPLVEEAWSAYNAKLLTCAALEETWTLQVDECDSRQDTLHEKACEHASSNRECASNFGHAYHWNLNAYNNDVEDVRQKEADRKREWETLHIVTCLLETVYTHVIHSIDSGEPCPTTESHPDETAAEINYCHVVEESMTANLTIQYCQQSHRPCQPEWNALYPNHDCTMDGWIGAANTERLGTCLPVPPDLPPVVDPPCTAQYIWDETGSFSQQLISSHGNTIADDELGEFFAVVSAHGWAGCAAPKACTPCEATELVVNAQYTGNEQCKPHQEHLHPGQRDLDTFRCLNGNQCIHAEGRCNHEENCDDGSDEDGCNTLWGAFAELGSQDCRFPIVTDVQFQCGTTDTCIHVAGRCDGINNCPGHEDEHGCTSTATLTVEAMTGYQATLEETTAAVGGQVFYDRGYTFDSLGSFSGHDVKFIKMSNEDKRIPTTHVQMKLRLPQPTTIYVSKLEEDNLPWLEADGWTLTSLEGVSYHGIQRQTRHTDWHTRQTFESDAIEDGSQWYSQHDSQSSERSHSFERERNGVEVVEERSAYGHSYDRAHTNGEHLDHSMSRFASQTWQSQGERQEEHYGPGEVWQRTFPAGVVEMRGDGGGDGSYVMFAAHPDHQVTPALTAPAVEYDTRLSAYWESGNCGPHGNDWNWGWCHRQGGTCEPTVYTDLCASGQAQLAEFHGTVAQNSYNSNGCNYFYYSQYVCTVGAPVAVEYDTRLSAYWESGNCGPEGNDWNWGWCQQQWGQCEQTVDTDLCTSGRAQLAKFHGTGAQNSYRSNGCNYFYYSQYVCMPSPGR